MRAAYRPGLVLLSLTLPLAAPSRAENPKAGEAKRKRLFDGKSLEGWKEADFFKPGKVYVKDGMIVMEKGKMMTGVTYARGDFPKLDYEVTLEGQRRAGQDFFCTTTCPVGNSFCSLVVGGWGGRVVGLSSLNGIDASENETSQTREFQQGRWYRVRIRVTLKKIEAWIDADQVVDVETVNRAISTRIECVPSRPFGVATWDTTGAVRDIRVRVLSEAERKAGAGKKTD